MELIIASPGGKEIGFWNDEKELDLDVGDTNAFEITIPLEGWNTDRLGFGTQIFIPNTEYGGIIGDIQTRTKSGTVVLTGDTWRGLLAQEIIVPPTGQDYYTISGELNTIIRTLMGNRYGSLFSVPITSTGVTVQNYQFERYCTLLSGIEKLLYSSNHRLDIKYMQGDPGQPGYVQLQAVPVGNYVDRTEFSQDCKVHFEVRDYRRGINHLICLGKGELRNRTVLNLYVQEDGTIGQTQHYKGLDHRAAVYDYSSVEDESKLQEDGIKRLRELMDYKECEVSVDDISLEVGDIVSGRDYVTGISVQKPIVRKILKIDNEKETVDYKLKGDD